MRQPVRHCTLAIIVACAVWASGCNRPELQAAPRERPRLTGMITCRPPLPLPEGSLAHVALVELRGKAAEAVRLSEESFPVSGRPPIAFALAYPAEAIDPARHYALRARITAADGSPEWASPRPALVLTHGRPAEAEIMLAPVGMLQQSAPPATFYFECTGLAFTARHEVRGLYLFLPGETVLLPEVRSASGAKYSDGRVSLWNRGEDAMLERQGRVYRDCRNNPNRAVWEDAKLNGVDFRAIGGEAEWYLDVYDQGRRIDLVTEYGRDYYIFPEVRRETLVDPPRTRYIARMGAHRIDLVLEPGDCRAGGETFETRVATTLGHRTYSGCGRPLH